MRTIETKVYKIGEHPDKEKCFDWIRENWDDLNDHSLYEAMESINALHNAIGGQLSYSIGVSPDSGQHITFVEYDKEILNNFDEGELPLTGVCWDYPLIEGLKNNDPNYLIRELHSDTEYLYSDKGLEELCDANEYEFDEDGEFYS